MSLSEIETHIQQHTTPTANDKEMLKNKLMTQLNENDHLFIFTEILQNMTKKIYTMTDNYTLFDLNDLDIDNFWKMCYNAQLMIDNHKRELVYNNSMLDNTKNIGDMTHKMNEQLKIYKKTEEISRINPQKDLSDYEKLRVDALKECSYSTYSDDSTSTDSASINNWHNNLHVSYNDTSQKVSKLLKNLNAYENSNHDQDIDDDESKQSICDADEPISDDDEIDDEISAILHKPSVTPTPSPTPISSPPPPTRKIQLSFKK